MASAHNSRSLERRRQKKPPNPSKENFLGRIEDARNSFLKTQDITPEIYEDQQDSLKEIQRRFSKQTPVLALREFINVKILSAHSPRELYVLKKSDEDLADDFHRSLIVDYSYNRYPLVYCLAVGAICVAKSTKGWQRCRILKLHTNQTCDAFLFDIGTIERISWYDLRVLIERYVDQKPFATRCGLVSSSSATLIDRFTLQSQKDFLNILENNNDFYTFVNRSSSTVSEIFLYYKSGREFVCVNNIFPRESLSESSNEELVPESKQSTSSSSMPKLVSKSDEASTATSTKTNESSDSSKSTKFIEVTNSNKTLDDVQSLPRSKVENVNDKNCAQIAESVHIKTEAADTSRHFAESEAADKSAEQMPQPDEDEDDQKINISAPQEVAVRHFEGFDAVYVCFGKYLVTFQNLHFDVQNYAQRYHQPDPEQLTSTERPNWEVNDLCMARRAVYGSKEWFRVKIMSIDDKKCKVFLRDVGKVVEVSLDELKPLKDELNNVRNFIWKMKLFKLSMKNDCTLDVKVGFQNSIRPYGEMAISVLEAHRNNEFSIILWGVKKTILALRPTQIEYVNINKELIKLGFATSLVDPNKPCTLDKITNKINSQLQKFEDVTPNATAEPYLDYDDLIMNQLQRNKKLSTKLMDVVQWLPSEKVTKKKFAAIPTYVSQNCIISVLEDSRSAIAEKIEDTLNEKVELVKATHELDWKQGDACFAPFVGKYYRATVRRVNLDKFSCVVRFVDYGNCASCRLNQLRKANMFGDIPILSRRYQLENIEPPENANGFWPEEVRAYCSQLILEKHCDVVTIRQSTEKSQPADDVETCILEIFTEDKDLASALIRKRYAKRINNQSTDEQASF